IHGGSAMAFADTTGGAATLINLPAGANGTTTIESKTNFMGAAKEGSTVIATATPLHRGRRTQVWQTRLETEEGRLVALVTQTQLILCSLSPRFSTASTALKAAEARGLDAAVAVRARGKADIHPGVASTASVAIDPTATSARNFCCDAQRRYAQGVLMC